MIWFLTLLLYIEGYSFFSLIIPIAFIFIQMYRLRIKDFQEYTETLLFVLFGSFIGIAFEISLHQIGLISYGSQNHFFPPIQILALYPLLLVFMKQVIQKFSHRSQLFIFGSILAFFLYLEGSFIQAFRLYPSIFIALILISSIWGLYFCLLKLLESKILLAVEKTYKEAKDETLYKLFYDGDCPICKREISYLKNKNHDEQMKFIDICSLEFEKEKEDLSYEKAMQAMHGRDEAGNLLVGLDAFSKAYAKSNLILLSSLLNLSFLRPILNPIYFLFAKYRMRITGRK